VTRLCGVRDERIPQHHHHQGDGPALAALCVGGLFMAALALGVEAFLRAENFSVGAEVSSPAVRDITVSAEDSVPARPDEGRFEGETKTVFV
jgi:hypothetical protein